MNCHAKFFSLMLTLLITVPSLTLHAADRDSIAKFPEQRQLDKLIDNTRIVYVGGDGPTASQDSVRSLISRFYMDQFRHSQDPKSPYFMFMSKDANLSFGVGGLIRMRGWFDWNGSIPANGFSIYSIPIPKDPTRRMHLAATPAGTSLFFTLLGRNKFFGNYMGYIECNFDGYKSVGFKLKKAYIQAGDWTAGYATSTFSDPAAQPYTIDGAGPNGKISKTNVLVRYLHTFKNNFSVGGSFEFPSSQADTDNILTKTCTDYIPDIAALAQYQWNDGLSHVRLSGLLRSIPYRDLKENKNHSVIGWGLQLSSTFKLFSPLNIYAIASAGKGQASYTGDLSIGAYDLVARPEEPGKLYAPASVSLTFGAKYNFLDNLFACLTLAQMRYYPKDNPGNAEYSYGQYGAFTVMWDITPRFQVGAEYLIGKRMNFNGEHANANRVDAMFQLSF